MLEKHEEVFEDGLGHRTRCKAHLELKPGAQPVFRKACPIALASNEPVEKELQRYEDRGIIESIARSDWAAPVVVAKKPNNRIRICTDFSTGLNNQLVVDFYPIPRPEDLYQKLQKGKKFNKLDLSDAYL